MDPETFGIWNLNKFYLYARKSTAETIERLINEAELSYLVARLPEGAELYFGLYNGLGTCSAPLEDDGLVARMLKALESSLAGETQIVGVAYEYQDNYLESSYRNNEPSLDPRGSVDFIDFLNRGKIKRLAFGSNRVDVLEPILLVTRQGNTCDWNNPSYAKFEFPEAGYVLGTYKADPYTEGLIAKLGGEWVHIESAETLESRGAIIRVIAGYNLHNLNLDNLNLSERFPITLKLTESRGGYSMTVPSIKIDYQGHRKEPIELMPPKSTFFYHGTLEKVLEQAKKDAVNCLRDMMHKANEMATFLFYE